MQAICAKYGIPDNWHGWIVENIDRGCDLQDMARQMGRDLAQVRNPLAALHEFAAQYRAVLDSRPLYQMPTAENINLGDAFARVVMRNASPAVLVLDSFLSADECRELVDMSKARMTRSHVVDDATGDNCLDQGRTSSGTFYQRGQTPLAGLVESRVHRLTGVDPGQYEGVQVMCYERGQEYRPHYDYFPPDKPGSQKHLRNGGQRILTVLMYLSTPLAGGHTLFPEVGLSVVPRAGLCCLFANTDPHGREDPLSRHGGAPVEAGEKWIATVWIRAGRLADR